MENSNKYMNYMITNHINLLSIEEIIEDKEACYNFNLSKMIADVCKNFENVYTLFDKSSELLLNCHSRNEYEEAALANLRYSMEELFYQIKKIYPGNKLMEFIIISHGATVIISIFLHLPNIMADVFKDEIFNYIVQKDLLKKNPL